MAVSTGRCNTSMKNVRRCLNDSYPFEGAALPRQRKYLGLSLREGLARFESARRANFEKPKHVLVQAWENSRTQAGIGAVSPGDLPVFLQQHDQAHRADIEAPRQHLGLNAA